MLNGSVGAAVRRESVLMVFVMKLQAAPVPRESAPHTRRLLYLDALDRRFVTSFCGIKRTSVKRHAHELFSKSRQLNEEHILCIASAISPSGSFILFVDISAGGPRRGPAHQLSGDIH